MTDAPDPSMVNDATRAALSDPDYRKAFHLRLSGRTDRDLTDAQLRAADLARRLTGTPAPGMPMPIREGSDR
jgi:hypothetical protein